MNEVDGIIKTIERYGWVQGWPGGPASGFCIVGANGHANRYGVGIQRVEQTVRVLFPERLQPYPKGKGLRPAARFNDHPDTTLEDVMLVLKHAREADHVGE